MSSKHDRKQDHHSPEHDKKLCDRYDIKWPSVYPVRIEPTADDEKKYAKQSYRAEKQLRVAKALNIITACAAGVGLFGLIYLHGQLTAMKESNRINNEALVTVQRAFVFPADKMLVL